jgi:hypothetical protein
MNCAEVFGCLYLNTTETGWVDNPAWTPNERQISRANWLYNNARNEEETRAAIEALQMLGQPIP